MRSCARSLQWICAAWWLLFTFSSQASGPPAFQYFVLDPETQNAPLFVYSLGDDNTITAGSTILELDLNEIGTIPGGADLSPGMLIQGTGPFATATDAEAVDIPSPAIFLGSSFVIPHVRNSHKLYLLSPSGDASVTIEVGESVETVVLSRGNVFEYSLGNDNAISSLIDSDQPILVSHIAESSGTRLDAYPVPPASLELWGVRSKNAVVGALEDATTVTVFTSDGHSASYSLDRGDRQSINIGDNASEGLASGLRIVANKPVAAVQYADSDGSEATSFLPTHYLATHYGIGVNSQYIAVVCPLAGTTVTLKDGDRPAITRACEGNPDNYPGKIYFGGSSDVIHVRKGALLVSSKPVFAYQEVTEGSEEKQLLGTKFSYVILDSWTGESPLTVFSHSDNNTISTATTTFILDRNRMAEIPVGMALEPGSEITGSAAFDLGTSSDGTDMPVASDFKGLMFAIPHIRGFHTYDLLSPVGNATAKIKIGAAETSIDLPEGEVVTFGAGSDNSAAAIVRSSHPIYLYHRAQSSQDGGSRYDAYPVTPASLNLWGVRSGRIVVAALENDTTISAYVDSGLSQNLGIQAGQQVEVTVGSDEAQGAGSAIHLVSNKPVSAIQHEDGDGSETTSLWSQEFRGSVFGIPVDAEYLAITCIEPNTELTLIDGALPPQTSSCSAVGLHPGKAYFRHGDGTWISAGSVLESSKPVVLYYEHAVSNDERNLLGAMTDSQSTISAEFTATPESGIAPLDVLFDGAASSSSSSISNYDWNFGDGENDTGITVTHLYQRAGSYTARLSVEDSSGERANVTSSIVVTPPVPEALVMEGGTLSTVTDTWQVVTLQNTYSSMVVIATPVIPNQAASPAVTRIRNAAENRFEIRLQNPSDLTLPGYPVHYVVVEEGQYSEASHGITMEALRAESSITGSSGSWLRQTFDYHGAYSKPVVLGQVLSDNDSAWSVFWASSDNNQADIPAASGLAFGKHVAEDSNSSRQNETIGYLVVEEGEYDLDEIRISVGVGTDSIGGIGNSDSGFVYPITTTSEPVAAVLSAAAMDGNDGGWPVLFGDNPLTNAGIQLAFDEDQIKDGERSHTSEQVAFLVFGSSSNQAPEARPTASPVLGDAPLDVEVDGSDSLDSDGTIAYYSWNFGDGSFADGMDASYQYASPGIYELELTVTDDDGAINRSGIVIEVKPPNAIPVSTISATPQSGEVPLIVTVDGSGSIDSDGAIVDYEWGFGDGSTDTRSVASHQYLDAGSYLLTLTVTDDDGAAHQSSMTITVTQASELNQTPVASFSVAPNSGTYPITISLDASTSSDSDGAITSYQWDFGDGNGVSGETVEHTYTSAGNYLVSLVVTDNDGETDQAFKYVNILPPNSLPLAAFSMSPHAGIAPLQVSFDASESTDIDGSVSDYSWDFGDGSSEVGSTVSHAFSSAGEYAITLTVTDNEGAIGQLVKNITAIDPGEMVAPVLVPLSGPATSNPQPISGTASSAEVRIYVNGVDQGTSIPNVNGEFSYLAALDHGDNQIYAIGVVNQVLSPQSNVVNISYSDDQPREWSNLVVSENTVWTTGEDNAPYRFISSYAGVEISEGVTLTIMPGVEVQFADFSYMDVRGTLQILGSESRNVRLGQSPGDSQSFQYDWSGIRVYSGGLLQMQRTEILDAYVGVEAVPSGTYDTDDDVAELEIVDSEFYDSEVKLSHVAGWIRDSTFTDAGIYVAIASLPSPYGFDISGNTIARNRYGIEIRSAVSDRITIRGNRISGSTSAGIYIYPDSRAVISDGNEIKNNNKGIEFVGSGFPVIQPVSGNSIYANTHNIYTLRYFFRDWADDAVIDATANWWGTTSISTINARIWDKNDEPGLPLVDFGRYLDSPATSSTLPNKNPRARYSYSPGAVRAKAPVMFNAALSSDDDGSIVNHSWDFGDGYTGSGQAIEHTFDTQGVYVVTLIVTDDDGATDGSYRNIAVSPQNQLPLASFIASPTTGQTPLNVSFDAGGSSDSGGEVTNYTWDFGDGSSATGITTDHQYLTPGIFTTTLTVADNDGATAQTSVVVTASPPNVAPSAIYIVDSASGDAPFLVNFDASSSSDIDGAITSYDWNFGDGSTGSGVIVSHTYENPGSFSATLTVTDDVGMSSQSTQVVHVEVPNTPPIASFVNDITTGFIPLSVNFDASFSSDSDGEIQSYQWDFGDGTLDTGEVVGHSFSAAGDYDVSLLVRDDKGASTSISNLITVLDNLEINVSSHQTGAITDESGVIISGTLSAPLNTGLTLNGEVIPINRSTFPMRFSVWKSLVEGNNVLEFSANSLSGLSTTTTITLVRQGNEPTLPYNVEVTNATGTATLTTEFSVSWLKAGVTQSVDFDFNGDGSTDYTYSMPVEQPPPSIEIAYDYLIPGNFVANVTINELAGGSYEFERLIRVADPVALDRMFQSDWDSFNQALLDEDQITAEVFMTESLKDKYSRVVTVLLPEFPAIYASYGDFELMEVTGDLSTYVLNRTVDGRDLLFFVYFRRDENGIWRLVSM